MAKRPAILIQAADSDANTDAQPEEGPDDPAPNGNPLSDVVTLPGYNHIDVVNAAWHQRGNRAEQSSKSLVDWALKVLRRRERK